MKRRLDFASPAKEALIVDWSKCFICQECTKEQLVNPCGNGSLLSREKIQESYNSLAARITEYQEVKSFFRRHIYHPRRIWTDTYAGF